MNSEISNVLKLSPVTIVKSDLAGGESKVDKAARSGAALAASEPLQNVQEQIVDEHGARADSKANAEVVKSAAAQGNSLLQSVRRNLQFQVDDSTKELVVKIVDSESGKTVRQIPSEEMLDFVKRMQELEGQHGSVLQDRA